jgi:hypothetical protein
VGEAGSEGARLGSWPIYLIGTVNALSTFNGGERSHSDSPREL